MTITVNGPNGVTIQFPAGTDVATIDRVMREATGMTPRPAASGGGMSAAAAGLTGLSQGLTFNFGDEIEGAGRAAYKKITGDQRPWSELYGESVQIPRDRIAQAKASNPVAYYGGELGGGVAVPGGLARLGLRGAVAAAADRGLAARSWAGAKEGAAYGAAYGAGAAEGDVADRLTGAASGAATGSVVGAAMPGAIDLVSAAGRRIATPIRAYARPHTAAGNKIAEAVYRDAPDAVRMAGNAHQRFADQFNTMAAANPSTVLMDAGGENLRGLVRAAGNIPNSAREGARRAVDTRQAGQYARIEDDLVTAFKEPKNYYDELGRLAAKMDEVGAKAIQPALRTETPMTPQLRAVMARPTLTELTSSVARKIADEGAPIGLETRTTLLHRIKMELDEQIALSQRAEKMGTKPQAGWDTRTLTILKRDLLNAIDNPTYKAGLKQYASQARLSNAAEDGFDEFRKLAPEQIREKLRGFETDVERQFYRLGAMRAIVDQVRQGNVTRDRTDGVFSSPQMMMKLRAVMPDQKAFREFQKQLVIEARLADSRKAMQGNSTTARQLAEGEQAGRDSQLLTSAVNAAGGGLTPVMNFLGQVGNRFSGLNPQTAAAITNIAMSRDPGQINALLRRSLEEAARTPMSRAQRTQATTSGLLAVGQ